MSEDTKIKQSSGNVFKDVGFSDAEAERALLKADLAFEIYNIIEAQKLTQAKAGKILGIDPSDMNQHQKIALPIPAHVERLAHNRQERDTRCPPHPERNNNGFFSVVTITPHHRSHLHRHSHRTSDIPL